MLELHWVRSSDNKLPEVLNSHVTRNWQSAFFEDHVSQVKSKPWGPPLWSQKSLAVNLFWAPPWPLEGTLVAHSTRPVASCIRSRDHQWYLHIELSSHNHPCASENLKSEKHLHIMLSYSLRNVHTKSWTAAYLVCSGPWQSWPNIRIAWIDAPKCQWHTWAENRKAHPSACDSIFLYFHSLCKSLKYGSSYGMGWYPQPIWKIKMQAWTDPNVIYRQKLNNFSVP